MVNGGQEKRVELARGGLGQEEVAVVGLEGSGPGRGVGATGVRQYTSICCQ